ncbi:MAG: hypothetical protein OXT09_04920 [Myxococcales bacterium]|nr:hypothetical protein [Myxococcales bacterium]
MRALLTAAALLLVCASARADAVLVVVNGDGPGEGFNDPRSVAPVGGNTGTTLGEQRMIAFQHAADIWGQLLDSEVPIIIDAQFNALDCSDGAVLGQATTTLLRANFPNAPEADTWFPIALADRLARTDLDPGEADIEAEFNSELDELSCFGGDGWYYGLDADNGNDVDLVAVALHEIAHGLGSSIFISLSTGELPGDGGYPTGDGRLAGDWQLDR